MSDRDLRALERRWQASGSLDDEVELLRATLQIGAVDAERLRLEAYLGREAARLVLGPDRPTRYDVVAPFVANWYATPLSPDLDEALAGVNALEAKHGRLAPALREWLALTWKRHPANYNQNSLLNPQMFRGFRAGVLGLYVENQDCFAFQTLQEEQGESDPLARQRRHALIVGTSSQLLCATLLLETCLATQFRQFGAEEVGPLGALRRGTIALEARNSVKPMLTALPLLCDPIRNWDPFDSVGEGVVSDPSLLSLAVHGDSHLVVTEDSLSSGVNRVMARNEELLWSSQERYGWID